MKRPVERDALFYTNYYTNALGKGILHRFSGTVLHVGEHVGVGVQGDGDAGMPQHLGVRLVLRRWRIDGTFVRLNAELRNRLRCRLGRDPHPSAGIVDSHSARTTGVGGTERGGFDPAKKVEGTKRHLLLDTEGLVLKAKVHSAKVPDEDGIRLLCWSRRASALSAFLTCGSKPDTGGGGRRWAEGRSWV